MTAQPLVKGFRGESLPLVSRSLTNGLRPARRFQLITSPGNAAAFTAREAALVPGAAMPIGGLRCRSWRLFSTARACRA
jgi:hypothetical protein